MNTQALFATGCIFDSHRGHYIYADVIELALSVGMPDTADDAGNTLADVVSDYRSTGGHGDLCEFIHEDFVAAVDWLNDNAAEPGNYFDMWEGDFTYQTQAWWDEFSY